jgi:hypothetical protein
MTTGERQARFRAAHPGYNKKYRGPSARQARQQLAAAAAALDATPAQGVPSEAVPADAAPAEAVPAIAWLAA